MNQIDYMNDFYCQKVLPLVYDDSLSYYEVLCKLRKLVNDVINNQNIIIGWFEQLQKLLDTKIKEYTENQLNNWLDDGTLSSLINKQLWDELQKQIDELNETVDNITTLATKFMLPSETYANNMIQRALDSKECVNVLLPNGTWKINKPLIIDCKKSLNGDIATTIVADYDNWIGSDYRAIIFRGREGVNVGNKAYNNKSGNFKISSIGAEKVKGIGVFFGTDKDIKVVDSVAYGFIDGKIENIFVEKMDTAFLFKESWNSDIENITVHDCRIGIDIHGKTVNVNYLCKMTNFTNANTTDKSDTKGVYIRQKLDYLDGVGRPEGLTFKNGCLIFGADINCHVDSALIVNFNKCIIDGANKMAFEIGIPIGLTIDGCYLYTNDNTQGSKVVNFSASQNTWNKVTIINSNIVSNKADYGIYSMDGSRQNITIDNNDFLNCKTMVSFNNVTNSIITSNTGEGTTTQGIYVQSGGENVIVDNNRTTDNIDILRLHPTTSTLIDIGNNTSLKSKTLIKGVLKIEPNQPIVSIPNVLGSERATSFVDYIAIVTQLNNQNHPVNINLGDTFSINFSETTVDSITKFAYELKAVPLIQIF